MDKVLRGEKGLEESQIAKKMGGIIVKHETVEYFDLFGNQVWSIRLEPLLRFEKEKKNYLTRLVNCTNIYHYPRKNYVLMGINTSGIKVLDCSNGSLVWENEDGPNKKIHLNDAVNNEFGIVDTFCSEFKTFHAWNIENGQKLWSIDIRNLFNKVKGIPGVNIPMRLMDVVSGNFLLQPMDEDENQCYILIHALTGRILMYFYEDIILQMATLSVEQQNDNDQHVTMLTNVILYTLNRVCLLEFKYQHRKADNVLISMDCTEKWSRNLEFQSYSGFFETKYLWIPLDGVTIRKRRSERRDNTPLDELDRRYLFDLMFIHIDPSYLKSRLERVRLDDGSLVYKENIVLKPSREHFVSLNRAGNGPMNLNRESESVFGEVRSNGELFLITQTAAMDTVVVIDLKKGNVKYSNH
ncbi:predicted protein [Naegleria gruberi]|uniref:Predicted protein n=1 Tax=Naegleria gruberi TaxID=5762 RepID=D2VA19_NAEGR|nr:uncharacterized protein NAEGRDRAFT_65708 [Naegleria gruberi]EFC46353.1 predicted protein [Naegleria gruberi]|eukprot:XP_002679097.1 predicted protein [Naegleria gruberi strain NEG-M]